MSRALWLLVGMLASLASPTRGDVILLSPAQLAIEDSALAELLMNRGEDPTALLPPSLADAIERRLVAPAAGSPALGNRFF